MKHKNSDSDQHVISDSQHLSRTSQNPSQPDGLALAPSEGMAGSPVLAVRHLQAAGRTIPVFLSRNEGGSVAARCVLEAGDTPIVDGPSMDEVLQLLQDAIESLLMARVRRPT